MLTVGRISYLPDDKKLREFRYKTQLKCFLSLSQIIPSTSKVVKIAQNYSERELEGTDEIIYLYDKLGVSKARNILLKKFYDSDSDYLLLLDDDNSFYDYYNISGLLTSLDKEPSIFTNMKIDVMRPVEPQYEPFKKENTRLNCDSNFVFKQASLSNVTGLFILINFKKYYNKEFYFNEDLKVGIGPDSECEIIDFEVNLMREGMNVLCCRNMIQKNSTAQTGLSTVFEGAEDINQSFKVMYHNTATRLGIPIESGKVKFSKVLDFFKGSIVIDYNLNIIKSKDRFLLL